MSKNRTIRALNFLKEVFEDDLEAMEALEHLENRVDYCDFSKCSEKSAISSSEFLLPESVSKDGFALFSDGACRGNPGPGAWGCIGQKGDGALLFEDSECEENTTNNKMELRGAIEALNNVLEFGDFSSEVHLFSDSKYVVEGIVNWVPGWKKRGWKKADKKTPENIELWQEFDEVVQRFKNLNFYWVKGHSGHPQNERCDSLANEALNNNGF